MKKLTFLLFGLFLFGLTLFSYAFVDPNLIYLKKLYTGFAFTNREITTGIYFLSVLIFFVFYGIFLYQAHKKILNILDTKLLVGLTLGVLLFSYPAVLSYDIFNYTTTAKILFTYHENPYIVMPIEFIGDPFLLFTHATNKLALYGPFWIIINGIPHFFGFGNFLLTLFNFKLLISMFYIGTSIFVWKITKSVFSTILFALNPLIIIETLIGAHNDIVMMFLTLLSFFLLMKKKIIFAVLFLSASILIKYATVFLIPVFVIAAFKIIKKQKVDWEKVYIFSFLSMIVIFLLSLFREEIYPWYAIWFLTFVPLIPNKKIILYVSLSLSLGLLLRHIPFMLLGTHFGITPLIKSFVTFVPALLVFLFKLRENLAACREDEAKQ